MKIKAIAALAKKNKYIQMWDDEKTRVQWISNGYAAYPLYGMPELDGESVLTVLDVPEMEREKYTVRMGPMPDGCVFDDTDETERALAPTVGLTLGYGGQVLAPARTSLGLLFFDPEFLRPVQDKPYELYERETDGGRIYLAIKSGLLLTAVIMPKAPNEEDILDRLETLERELRTTISRRAAESREEGAEAGEQYGVEVDEETGEVLDGG
ncbi:MAG: hypothetical protein VB039_05210 [Oscillospiraceae bacterium]|nr:hypothetical protein [Oscillospiraceae bacterium]